jgi:hypothetical protein
MAHAAFQHVAREFELPDLLMRADDVRALGEHPGWLLVLESIQEHERKLTEQLLHPTAKAEDVDRLRGEIRGLRSAREAADAIVSLAVEREREANRALAAQQEHANA